MNNNLRDEIERSKASGEQQRMAKIMEMMERLTETQNQTVDVMTRIIEEMGELKEKVKDIEFVIKEHCQVADYCPHTMR